MDIAALQPNNLERGLGTRVEAFAASDSIVQNWTSQIHAAAADLPGNATNEVRLSIEKRIHDLIPHDLDALDPLLRGIVQTYVDRQQDQYVAEAARGSLLTLELNFDRFSAGDTPIWNTRAIFEHGFAGGYAELTLNGSIGWYHNRPTAFPAPNVSPASRVIDRFRDGQLAGQVDVRLGTARANVGTVSLASKWQYLSENNAVTGTNATLLYEPGHIFVVQTKLVMPAKGATMITPLSISWSNRTALIAESNKVSANAGVSYDLDTVLSRLRPH